MTPFFLGKCFIRITNHDNSPQAWSFDTRMINMTMNLFVLRLGCSTKEVKLRFGLGTFLLEGFTANLSMSQRYLDLEQLISKVIHYSLESLAFVFMTLLMLANNIMKLLNGRL